ncbi:MAG: STAS domain-containing protein [Gammaproteobacteria bacterium]|jgi:phospholipid transport system transporter-binding protein
MTEPRLDNAGNGDWRLSGDLVFGNVAGLLKEVGSRFAGEDTIRVDLAGVTRADSAGLALLVEWLRESERRDKSIRFLNMPEQMRSIARVCGLDRILTAS